MKRSNPSRIIHKMRQFEIFEKQIIKMLDKRIMHPIKTKETYPSTSAIIARRSFIRTKISAQLIRYSPKT